MTNPNIPRLVSYRDYIELEICLRIYELCNDRQFGHLGKLDFANFLNLRDTADTVYIKSKEKLRVCYLVWQLSKTLPDNHVRESWRESLLEVLGISPSYYKSHYSDIGGAGQTEVNYEFAQRVKDIIPQP